MNRLFTGLEKVTRPQFALFWCVVLVSALTWSRFLLSVSLWALWVVSLVSLSKVALRQPWASLQSMRLTPQYFARWWRQPDFLWLTLPFFTILISGLWSDDGAMWFRWVRMRLPFLVLPIAFASLPPLSRAHFRVVLYAYFGVVVASCGVVLGLYALNYEQVTHFLGEGRPIPYMKAHIVFSLQTAFAIMVGWDLWERRFRLKWAWESYFLAVGTLFLVIALHVLAVRSGILAFYVCVFVKSIFMILRQKRYILGVSSLVLMLAAPVVAYYNIPSFYNRVSYAAYDIDLYLKGQTGDLSDLQRIVTLKVGFEAFQKAPLWGIGIGDMERDLTAIYAEKYPNLPFKMPHNELLFVAIATGSIGLLVFLFSFLRPIFVQKRYLDSLFLLFNTVIGFSFLIDYIIEGAFGSAFYVFFTCLFIKYYQSNGKMD